MTTVAALFEGIQSGDVERVEELVRAEPGLLEAREERGLSPLMVAIYRGAAEMVELLRRFGSPPDIHEASALGDLAALRACVEAHPDSVGTAGADGFTPLHLASFFGHAEAATLLLDKGADVRAWGSNALRNQPLHAAIAGKRDPGVIRALLEHGADVNAVAGGGYTPLHLAASRGDVELLAQLIGRGARAMHTDDGRAPAEIAAGYGHEKAAAWLEQRLGTR